MTKDLVSMYLERKSYLAIDVQRSVGTHLSH